MTLAQWLRASCAIAALVEVAFCAVPARADCRADLVATQQSLETTRAGIDTAQKASDAQRCPAYRRHYAAMVKVRDVFARCDTGSLKAEHAAQLNASIEGFRKQMPRGCRP